MAEVDSPLTRTTYDEVTGTLTFYFSQPPPPPPAGVDPSLWWAGDRQFTVAVKAPKSATTTGSAIYFDAASKTYRKVTLVNNAWQMPGVLCDENGNPI